MKKTWRLIIFRDNSQFGQRSIADQVLSFANKHELKPGEIIPFPFPLPHSDGRFMECLYFSEKDLVGERG